MMPHISNGFPNADIAPATGSSGLASILRRPGTVLPLAILSVTAVSVAVLYPTLQPHMDGVSSLHWST